MKAPSSTNIKALKKEISEDIFPLERAVNNPEVNTFIPTNKNAKEKMYNPLSDKSKTSLDDDTKILTIFGAKAIDAANTNNDETIRKIFEYLNVSFTLATLSAP